MKAFLMYKDRDFDLQQPLPWNEQELTQDLELNTLLNAMARGDKFLFAVARQAVLPGLNDPDTIVYRQHILKDCLQNPTVITALYQIAAEALDGRKRSYWSFSSRYPSSILYGAVEVMQVYVEILKRLRAIADQHADQFESEGFTTLFAMLQRELSDSYFASIQSHLKRLKFRDGVLISAQLGKGNKGAHYVLRRPNDRKQSLVERIFTQKPPAYSYHVDPRDESGANALSELENRGIHLVANVLAQSTDHILSFFNLLQTELAFYMGCLNLQATLCEKGEPVCFPVPVAAHERRHAFQGLYDVCLALCLEQSVVGNAVNADNKDLMIITGANQGGKSTFLRSIGLAQVMMQCGMYVPAEAFCANVCQGIYTHYKREEDITMKRGKLEEELSRMSAIVDHIPPHSLLLFNESFAATNEREGSEIARQVVRAFMERRVKVFFVTHLYEFARSVYENRMPNSLFLRAERQAGGGRTFKLIEGEPLDTSYGADLYARIFHGTEAVLPGRQSA